jgi:gas vesicle protein
MKSAPLLGFIAGIAAGSVLGILFAPEKGTKTRRKLKDKASELSDEISRKIRKLEKIDEEILKNGKSTISHINKSIVDRY